jgi:hypothetical protein
VDVGGAGCDDGGVDVGGSEEGADVEGAEPDDGVVPAELVGGGFLSAGTPPTAWSRGVSSTPAGASIWATLAGSDGSLSPAVDLPIAKAAPAATSRPTTAIAMALELSPTPRRSPHG